NLVAKGTQESKITILDQLSLEYGTKNSVPFSEISDVAYEQKSRQLFMIGDKGYIYKFSANFNKKIENLKYIDGFRVKKAKREESQLDSEGLTYNDKQELLISFERRAKISKLSPKGLIKLDYKLPKKLRKTTAYRDKNKIFEALAFHPKYGILTIAEYPIKKRKKSNQTIYSLKGKEWHFKTEKYKNSAVTAIEVMDDGNILVLERAYSGLSNPLMITLKKVYIDNCDKKNRCKSEVLLSFDSFDSWAMGNFEGLAKVGKNRFVMVSDNQNRSFLPTLLIYFEVK
ncbi:esterase-like activity of phytase family protein, partial [Sulfurovum sp. bin170]|uniref:esterase-like activity of phytase family protein n=1 Tax=Sulfurovum sp. bin170 TaxID=2695268 RepID=UPI0013DFEB3C